MMNPAEFANIAKAENDFWWYRGMRGIMFRLLDPVARQRHFTRVLEAGCGTGHFAHALEERYGWPVYPLDLGWDGLMYGRSLGVQRMTQGDIQTLPFRNGAFDAVFSMDVIVHMALGDEEKPMREFHRVLCAGGFLAVRVSALDVLRSRHSEFAMERQRFTRSRLVKLAENCGFRVTRCTYANTFLLPVAFTKFRIVEPLLRTKPESGVKPVSPALDAILHAPLAWEAELIGSGVNFPAGQSLILLAERR